MDFNRSIQDEVEEEQIEDNVTLEERLEHLNLDDQLENDELENDEVENDDGSDYDDDDDYEDYDNNNNNDNDDDEEEEEEEEIDAYEGEEVDEVIPVSVSNSALHDSEGRNIDSNKSDTDGLTCPICYEAWTDGGDHKVCCLPCGHLFGWSCVTKWLKNRRSHGKCPQCNKVSKVKDVRILYVNRVCVADEELRERVRSLEAKCARAHLEQKRLRSLEAKCADLEQKLHSEMVRGFHDMRVGFRNVDAQHEQRQQQFTQYNESQQQHQQRMEQSQQRMEQSQQRVEDIVRATRYDLGWSNYRGDWHRHNFELFSSNPAEYYGTHYQRPLYYDNPAHPPTAPVYDERAALEDAQRRFQREFPNGRPKRDGSGSSFWPYGDYLR
ncbi:uncharacterized protein [Rutidosis leptorrhynchoides]|uniref:uncharacterized protein n=1 Tax=Rutidosis leptorrhynchoides TaxID=125765 RepID=UPI003A99DAAB